MILSWGVLFAFYLLFTGNGQPAELAAGGAASGLVALFEVARRATSERRIDVAWSWLGVLVPALGRLVVDTHRVGAALLAALLRPAPSGRFREIPFPGGSVTAETAARRALAIFAVSLAPNAYVVDCDRRKRRLVVHELLSDEGRKGKSTT